MAENKRNEKEECLKCKLKNGKDWIQCDRCNKRTHQECTYLKGIAKKVVNEIPYYCDVCAIELQCMDNEIKELRDTIKEMRLMMRGMQRDMTYFRDEISNTSAKVNELDVEQMHNFMAMVHNEMTEIKGEIANLKDKEKTDEINNKLELVTSEIKSVVNNIDEKKKNNVCRYFENEENADCEIGSGWENSSRK